MRIPPVTGQYVGLGEGDVSLEIAKIKAHLKAKYTPARLTLDDGSVFTAALTAEVKREQAIFLGDGRLKPSDNVIPGVINLAFKYACGYLKKEVLLPLCFTAEGHMSDMYVGPVAWRGERLQAENRAIWRPTGYVNNTIPFKTATGVNELARRVGQTVQDDGIKFPAGTPFVIGGFSEGGLLISKFYRDWLAPGKPLNWRLKDLRGVVAAGNAYREKGVVAEWIPDGPAPDRQGLSNERFVNTPTHLWKEVARAGDLYTDNQSSGDTALFKTMCYLLIAEGSFSGGAAGFLARVYDLLSPADDLIPVAMAIFDGMRFVGNMSPHGIYDMNPALDFFRRQLAGPPVIWPAEFRVVRDK